MIELCITLTLCIKLTQICDVKTVNTTGYRNSNDVSIIFID